MKKDNEEEITRKKELRSLKKELQKQKRNLEEIEYVKNKKKQKKNLGEIEYLKNKITAFIVEKSQDKEDAIAMAIKKAEDTSEQKRVEWNNERTKEREDAITRAKTETEVALTRAK